MQCDLEQPRALGRLMRELPEEAAPPYDWCEFQRRAAQRALARTSQSGARAFAALTALAVGILAISLRVGQPARPGQEAPAKDPHAVLAAREDPELPGAATTAGPRTGLPFSAARTEALEHWLASLPDNRALVQIGPRAAVTGLEDRLAEVDDLLTAERIDQARPAQLLALQREHGLLVSSLAQVRYAEQLVDEAR
jgi:hypothetical protein